MIEKHYLKVAKMQEKNKTRIHKVSDIFFSMIVFFSRDISIFTVSYS